jgi:hypothetical protein
MPIIPVDTRNQDRTTSGEPPYIGELRRLATLPGNAQRPLQQALARYEQRQKCAVSR